MRRRSLLILGAILVACALALGPGSRPASVLGATSTSYPVVINCTSTGQVCSPPFTVTVGTTGPLTANFTASATHCSSISVTFSVDGTLKYTSPPLPPGVSTGTINLGPVSAGGHRLSVQATGVVGGCNTGSLGSWSGTLTVQPAQGQTFFCSGGICCQRDPTFLLYCL